MRDVFMLWYSVTPVYNMYLVFFSPPDAVPFENLNFLKINKSVGKKKKIAGSVKVMHVKCIQQCLAHGESSNDLLT